MPIHFSILLLFFGNNIYAQKDAIISGVVSDANSTLNGATITVQEVNITTTTDSSGAFEISIQPGTYSIEASYASHETKVINNIVISNDKVNTLNFFLTGKDELEEVVVSYGRQRARDVITGAIATVNTPELQDMPVGQGARRAGKSI